MNVPRWHTRHAGGGAWAAWLIGATAAVGLETAGIVYLAEILLALAAVWVVVTHLGSSTLWRPPFSVFCLLLAVGLAGYVVSDLVWNTEAGRWLRGWARMAALTGNFIGLYGLCRRRPANFLAYCAGSAMGSLVYLTLRDRILADWKLGAAVPFTLLIACLCGFARPGRLLAPAFALCLAGLVHVLLDSRAIGGTCALAGLLLLLRHAAAARRRTSQPVALALAALAGAGLFAGTYRWSDGRFSGRRLQAVAWRAASLATALGGIAQSPWIGNGSQANDSAFQSEYETRYAEASGERYRGLATDTSTFTPHSQILQAWFEAGIAGVLLFLFLAWRLVPALRFCVWQRPPDNLTALFSVWLVYAGWQLLFSPFAGRARLEVAAAAVVICLTENERRWMRRRVVRWPEQREMAVAR